MTIKVPYSRTKKRLKLSLGDKFTSASLQSTGLRIDGNKVMSGDGEYNSSE
jgi:hypothetical protein